MTGRDLGSYTPAWLDRMIGAAFSIAGWELSKYLLKHVALGWR